MCECVCVCVCVCVGRCFGCRSDTVGGTEVNFVSVCVCLGRCVDLRKQLKLLTWEVKGN